MNIHNLNYLVAKFNTVDRKIFPGSMSQIEILIFIFLCIKNKIEVVVESGRQYGYSTFFISLFCKKNNIKFISIDNEIDLKINNFSRKLLKKNKVIYKKVDFYKSIDHILSSFKNKKKALLIDGPKGRRVHIKSYFLAKKFNNLIFIFFDNMPNSYLSARALFMCLKVYCFKKCFNQSDFKSNSVANHEINDFKKNKIINKYTKTYFNKNKDFDFAYFYIKDINKSIFCYVKILFFFFIILLQKIFNKIFLSIVINKKNYE
jgi:hypothetical protein